MISRSSKLYRERRGHIPTVRGPSPALAPTLAPIHRLVVRPPLPDPAQLLALNPETPDSGATMIWPNGVAGETAQ